MSIVVQLFDRQRIAGSNYRKNHRLLRKLILRESSKFEKIWQIQSKSPIMYEEKKIFLDNYRTCYTCFGLKGLPKLLYKKPASRGKKTQDALLCSVTLDNLEPSIIKFRGHQPHLLTLSSNNLLQRVHLETGEILQSVFLSQKYKFRYLAWAEVMDTVVVKSTQFQSAVHPLLLALAVFQVYPLQILGMIEIRKEIFGNDVLDATMTSGMLITFHRRGRIRLYSFQRILERFITKNMKLGEKCEGNEEGVVGEHPLGIPCNIHLTECPDVLLEVANCVEHSIVIGGFPWHYLINYEPSGGNIFAFSLQNKEMAKNGELTMECSPSYDGEKVWFHCDESGRIVHTGPQMMRMLKLHQSSNYTEVVEVFKIKTTDKKGRSNKQLMTSSGRVIKHRVFDSSIVSPVHESLKSVEYENELDLLFVVNTDLGDRVRLCYHDNYNGQLYKVVLLDEIWEEHIDYDITADLDTICCLMKDHGKYHCHLYKLSRDEKIE
ncbi:DDB1- and CUL4-associated factor 17-like isoform X2 [Anneissia japonica]|uniref:DDB1- and CUL4-associated factor 17-like isoform X1 n=1 Tax=Anneissia japonica TaxID=1529436 RepID=UPI0014257A4B|nr:DDB1- and CUL4-associated factor 17-like isoform X1 [Anneissia japonica]XP_033097875.1 DDB1- and CUL4-associated factor 17-like isoform X2 [Anneissia japonica]